MKYLDGFRDSAAAAVLRDRIETLCKRLGGRNINIMEVCGTHTMAIARHGIRNLMPDNVNLISGPGCPVCVTGAGYVDEAIRLAEKGHVIATFGDMLYVPGSRGSLAECRSEGGRIQVCYGPAGALELARVFPDRETVFLAVGFETTVAPTVTLIKPALQEPARNFSLLTSFKAIPPVLKVLMADPEVRLDALICPGHVSAIIGANAYRPLAEAGLHCVIAGFEPLDILYGIAGILEQYTTGEAMVINQYSRVVKPDGNLRAQALMRKYLEPCDAHWRGIGTLPSSGFAIRPEYSACDASIRFGLNLEIGEEAPDCLCGQVIKGIATPPDCSLFASGCKPDHPVGPCMVSSEGACAAYYRYCG